MSMGAGESPAPDRKTAGIAGFWRRFAAFLIDVTVLAVPGFFVGFTFFDQLAQLGVWGRAIGFAIALLYFGLMNSSLAGGQTLGKRLLHIRVVDEADQTIRLGRSFARYAILGAPYFLNNAYFATSKVFASFLGLVFCFLVFGIGLSILYLMVFNRRNRRSLHDLMLKTYVVKTARDITAPKPPTWSGHYVVVALLLLGSIAIPILLSPLADRAPFKDLLVVQTALQEQPNVHAASIVAGKTVFWDNSGSHVVTSVAATVRVGGRVDNYDRVCNKIARIILEKYPPASQADRISVAITRGFDLGIASWNFNQGFNYSPAEWQQRVESDSPPST